MGLNNPTYNILICPLDWGLGHVSRIIPIIIKLQQQSCKIYIACSKKQYLFLLHEGIKFEWIPYASPQIRYKSKKLNALDLIFLIPKILSGIRQDKKKIKQWKKKYHFHLIISDSRLGCFDKEIPSIILIHQLNIKLPNFFRWAEPLLSYFVKKQISQFKNCWIPDIPYKPNYAGNLSIAKKIKAEYVGLLSRFEKITHKDFPILYEIIGIVSGPEPQRTIFANILLEQFKKTKKTCALVLGKPESENSDYKDDNISIFSFANTTKLYELIQSSKYIIARSGYSTIMDLLCLNRTAILVPTPGQTEQEYLAKYYRKLNKFVISTQDKLNINEAIEQLNSLSLSSKNVPKQFLDYAIEQLFEKLIKK